MTITMDPRDEWSKYVDRYAGTRPEDLSCPGRRVETQRGLGTPNLRRMGLLQSGRYRRASPTSNERGHNATIESQKQSELCILGATTRGRTRRMVHVRGAPRADSPDLSARPNRLSTSPNQT